MYYYYCTTICNYYSLSYYSLCYYTLVDGDFRVPRYCIAVRSTVPFSEGGRFDSSWLLPLFFFLCILFSCCGTMPCYCTNVFVPHLLTVRVTFNVYYYYYTVRSLFELLLYHSKMVIKRVVLEELRNYSRNLLLQWWLAAVICRANF
jgi:hypothetical protein